jgi:hypothetical protein
MVIQFTRLQAPEKNYPYNQPVKDGAVMIYLLLLAETVFRVIISSRKRGLKLN